MRQHRFPRHANPALIEALKKSGELDELLEGRGLRWTPVKTVGPPPRPTQPFIIEKPDWDAEERERKERERQQREAEFQAELERRLESEAAEPPARPTPPAPKPSRWRRSLA